MRGLREPLVSRGFRCGPDRPSDLSFTVTVPPDFPCYYDITGKDYSHNKWAYTLTQLRNYLEGALTLARAGGAYRTEAEFEDARASASVRAKTSRFTGVSWFERTGKWTAAISVQGYQTFLGSFDEEEDAARTYDAALGSSTRASRRSTSLGKRRSPRLWPRCRRCPRLPRRHRRLRRHPQGLRADLDARRRQRRLR